MMEILCKLADYQLFVLNRNVFWETLCFKCSKKRKRLFFDDGFLCLGRR